MITPSEEPTLPAVSEDLFLDGALRVVQPLKGYHRSGSDALFLAAMVHESGHVIDLGAGVGVAGLAVAARLAETRVSLVEIDPVMLALARRTLGLNPALAGRVDLFRHDVTSGEEGRRLSGLERECADDVIINPPYRLETSVRATPHAEKARAHLISSPEALEPWLRAGAALLKPGGRISMIVDAALFPAILALFDRRFGALTLRGLHPRAGQSAERLLLQAIKGRRTPPRLLEGLVLHEAGEGYRPEIAALLAGKGAIAMQS